jgi:hypothetical protein
VRRSIIVLVLTACAGPNVPGDPIGDPGSDSGGDTGGKGDGDDPVPPAIWQPTPGTTWQWQLTGTIDTSFDVAMYDIDLFDAPDATLVQLATDARKVICYFSAGSREDWRADAGDFPAATLGSPLDGWPGERWIDIRSPDVRGIMRARLDRAKARGCDGVEPDNVDGFANGNGLGLTAADQLDYNRFLAAEAHARGLSVGLKNDLDQIPMLLSDFDWALDEQCFEFDECDQLSPFIDAGKAVFQVEYGGAARATAVCADAVALEFSTLVKQMSLSATRIACD